MKQMTFAGLAKAAVLGLSSVLAHAQGLPPETVAMADAALDKAIAATESLNLGEGAKLTPLQLGRQSVSFVRSGQSMISLSLRPASAVAVSTKFTVLNITKGPSESLLRMMEILARPMFDACASVGGSTSYQQRGRWLGEEISSHLVEFESLALRQRLSGQHTCEIDGHPAFVFVVTPMGRGEREFPYTVKVSMMVWAVPAREVSPALGVAGAEADAFERQADVMRSAARPGTEVQVPASALQLDGVTGLSPGTWVCALLLDRKEGLLQVQVGATPIFVPATAAVPRVFADGARPGLPTPCRPLRQAGR